MAKYKVFVRLELEGVYEAENEEEAFIIASYAAISGGDWQSDIEELEGEE